MWNRTVDSMVVEWGLHNWAYELNIAKSSTTSVDLDNRDEGKNIIDFGNIGDG